MLYLFAIAWHFTQNDLAVTMCEPLTGMGTERKLADYLAAARWQTLLLQPEKREQRLVV